MTTMYNFSLFFFEKQSVLYSGPFLKVPGLGKPRIVFWCQQQKKEKQLRFVEPLSLVPMQIDNSMLAASPSRPTPNHRSSKPNPSPRTMNLSQQIHLPLWEASFDGNVQQVQHILRQKDPDINQTNQKGQSCLWIACFQGHLEVVDYLMSVTEIRKVTESLFKLVDNTVPCCEVDTPDKELGKTPLYVACEMNRIQVVQYLLEETDASVNIPNKMGESPLHIASFHGYNDIVKLLLSNKCAVNRCGEKKKRTALNIASYLGHKIVVEQLLQHPYINTRLKDCFGFDPLASAIDK